MKIHLDYLEGRVEELENTNSKLTNEKKTYTKKLAVLEDKVKFKDTDHLRELEDQKTKLFKLQGKIDQMERKYKDQIERLSKEIESYKS